MGTKHDKTLRLSNAISRINDHGALLVFPINNRELPNSLWAEFFPKTKMVWEWNEDSDYKVADTWQLMKALSDCREVVYSKWYQGRATFFSRELFTAMLALARTARIPRHELSETARILFEVLENNSPLSTKELKALTELRGKDNESAYSRGMKELFTRFLIVGFGEVEDGAFPSLAVGATELLFEDLWREGADMPPRKARALIDRLMPAGSHFRKFLEKTADLEEAR
jgi:hypothetical protein